MQSIKAIELPNFALPKMGNGIETEYLRYFAFFGNFGIGRLTSIEDTVC